MSRQGRAAAGRVTLLVAVLVVLAGAGGFGGYVITRAARGPQAAPRPSPTPPLPSAYLGAQASPAPVVTGPDGAAALPSAAALARQLAGVVTAPGLGGRLLATVLDAQTGAVLYDRSGAATAAPASTAKILTAAAVLAVHPPTARITTPVVAGPDGAVVLVGAGDPTLTGAPAGKPGAYPQAARLSDLAAQLRRAGVRPTRIVVADGLFSGPAVSPAWAAEDVPSDYASAITALLADGGRATPGAVQRSTAPDLAAGHELAAALGTAQLPVVRGAAPAGARLLASVQSAPYSVLIDQMLQESDNVIAECLARQVAIALHLPASFTGSAAAVRAALVRLGVDPGAGMADGSGLAARDRLSPDTLAQVLRLVVGARAPQLRALLAGLPVAGWSGTLQDRYLAGAARAGAGVVRAKTGTLTGVSTLAGTVHDRSGRLLVFALLADQAPATAPAEAALDVVAARLAGCGCT